MTYSRLNAINDITVHTLTNVNVANNTATKLGEITLSAGKWLLIGVCGWDSNSTGMRRFSLSDSNSLTQHRLNSTMAVPVSGFNQNMPPVVEAFTITAQKTYYMYGFQNSGSTLTAYPAITAIKLA